LLRAGLHQAQAAPEAGANPGRQAVLDAPPAAQEVEQWRQLLLQSGFSPEMATDLLGNQTPASVAELRARLAALAPAAPPPKTQEAPKPLYLPEDLRLRSLWWGDHSAPESGLGEGERGLTQESEGQPWTHNFTPENRGEFTAWLNALAAPPAAPGPGLGGGPLGPLSPEMRQVVWSQLEAGILGNLKPGESRLDLVLDPPHLGRVELTLNLKGEHLAVTAMLTRPEVAHWAGAGVEQLVQALAQQGLILSQFQVQVREGRGDNPGFLSQEVRAMGRKEPAPSDGEAARRRRTGRVDRFV
jgi:flagellar hook-length control protein FliK